MPRRVGDVAQPLEVLRRGGDHPGCALHGLDQDGGDALVLPLEDLLGSVGVVERDLDELPGDAGEDAGRHAVGRDADGRAADDHEIGVAVVAALRLCERGAAGERAREPHGEQVGLRPRHEEADSLDGRHPLDEQ